MAHAHHFLSRLDRVPRAVVDEALALYRDPARVAWAIAQARIPKEQARVALSLGDATRGPFVVVTRDGHFVTCLAEGMSPGDLPIIAHGQLRAASAKLEEHRSRRDLAEQLTAPSGHDAIDVARLLYTRGDALTREELLAISAWQPFLVGDWAKRLLEAFDDVARSWPLLASMRRHFDRPGTVGENALLAYWNKLHALAHLGLLVGMANREWLVRFSEAVLRDLDLTFSGMLVRQRRLSHALRGAWIAGRTGKAGLPIYAKQAARPDADYDTTYDAALALTAIGLRHAHHRDDARRALAPLASRGDELARCLHATAAHVLGDPEAAARGAIDAGKKVALVLAERAPAGSPYAAADAEQIDDDYARLALVNVDFPVGRVAPGGFALDVLAVSLVARGAPEDFYMPADMRRDVGLPYIALRAVRALDPHGTETRPPESVRRTSPKVGRNDPCACGSGKKAKRCCGVS